MAGLRDRLGRFLFRRRWSVDVLWLLVLAGAVTAAVTSEGPVNTRATIPGIESQDAFDLLAERFPDTRSDGASATLVVVAPGGGSLGAPANQAAVEEALARSPTARRCRGCCRPRRARASAPTAAPASRR